MLILAFLHLFIQVIGILAKVPQEDMNRYTVIHVACRLVYNLTYLAASSRSSSLLRTIVFQVSIYPAIAIFLKAARALA